MNTTERTSGSLVGPSMTDPKRHLLLASPFLLLLVGHLAAVGSAREFGLWAWVPLQCAYWVSLAVICWSSGQVPALFLAYRRKASWRWWLPNVLVGVIPLPILLRNTSLLKMHSLVAYWIAIAVLNPVLEEAYWRGLLGTLTSRWPAALSILYTSLLFTAAHPLLWGVFSLGNRSWQTAVALLVMGAVWGITFRRTGSLRAVTLSHCLVDLGNMTVWVFMNLYVPPK